MSNTTTAMPAIKGISNIDEDTVSKLYAQCGIPQPQYVASSSKHTMYRGKEVTESEVQWNKAHEYGHSITKDSSADVVVEEIVLTPYISIRYTYNRMSN